MRNGVERAEIVIVGAGLAGSSLAVRLARRPDLASRVVVLDAEPTARNDRTWCSWRFDPHPFSRSITASWHRVLVQDERRSVPIELPRPYDCVRAADFHVQVAEEISTTGHVELRRGVSVRAVRPGADGLRVEHDEGTVLARLVFDSRPPPAPPDGTLVQAFVGWEIETERDAFDPSMATLMDFRVPQDGAIHFVYALPFAKRRALIESTWLVPAPAAVPDDRPLLAWLRAHLRSQAQAGSDDFTIRRREHGLLTMSADRGPTVAGRSRHVAIGLRGGALRASSGYAFDRVQRISDALCRQLEQQDWRQAGLEPPRLDARIDRHMDRLFLSLLARRPELGPRLFVDLFAHCPADRLLRFLADRASTADRWAVVRALPTAPMLRQVTLPTHRAA
ncbi:MAG: lycopene cyclase family protein [Acidobacteriota bacterium]